MLLKPTVKTQSILTATYPQEQYQLLPNGGRETTPAALNMDSCLIAEIPFHDIPGTDLVMTSSGSSSSSSSSRDNAIAILRGTQVIYQSEMGTGSFTTTFNSGLLFTYVRNLCNNNDSTMAYELLEILKSRNVELG